MLIKYRGWIPTVTGNLSFSTIGNGRYPKKRFKLFKDFKGSNRFTVVAQERRTTDALFGRLGEYLNSRRGIVGRFVFLYFGVSVKEGKYQAIRGPAYIVTLELYDELSTMLEALARSPTQDKFGETFSLLINTLNEATKGVLAKCGSELLRDGRHTIELKGSTKQEELIASQIHFFLRDVCHTHQHHQPTSDTILDVYPLKEGDLFWRQETTYALFRWIIQQKRSRNSHAISAAKGVLAYSQAFKALHVSGIPDEDSLPRYMEQPLSDSLDAALHSNGLQKQRVREVSEKYFGRYIPLLIGALSAFALYVSPGENLAENWQTNLFSNAAQYIRDNPVIAALWLFIFPFLTTVWRRSQRLAARSEWPRDLFRLWLALPKWPTVLSMVLIVSGLIIMAFAFAQDEIVPNRLHPNQQSIGEK